MAESSDVAASPVGRPSGLRIDRSHRRRRPSGEPPPLPRQLNRTAWTWLAVTLVLIVLSVVFTRSRFAGTLDVVDHQILGWLADSRTRPLTRVATVVAGLASGLALQVLWLASLVVLVFFRRWRHLFAWIVAMFFVSNGTALQSALLHRPRPIGVEIIGSWEGFAMPSRPVAVLTVVLLGLCTRSCPRAAGGRRPSRCAASSSAVALARIYLGVDHPTDVVVGVVIGVAVPLVAFRLLAPNEVFPVTYGRRQRGPPRRRRPRGDAIRTRSRTSSASTCVEVRAFGLAGSAGRRRCASVSTGEADAVLFGKLYAANHLRADRWYKLGRTLLYGGSRTRAVHHRPAARAVRGLPPAPDAAPPAASRRALRHRGDHPRARVPARHRVLGRRRRDRRRRRRRRHHRRGLRLVRPLWDAGLAHRDIKPSNLLVQDGRLSLIDVAFGEVRPSPWRQAVDLANMMLVLALRSDAERVYERAPLYFTPGRDRRGVRRHARA